MARSGLSLDLLGIRVVAVLVKARTLLSREYVRVLRVGPTSLS